MALWLHPVSFDYLEDETRGFHLRIADVCNLKKSTVLHFLCFDRNVADLVEDGNEADVAVPAAEFLQKAQRARYTHVDGLKGEMQFVGVDNSAEPFEFHIEAKRGFFTPLKDGRFSGVHWTEVRSDVRIGWRGPMVLEDFLPHFPLVYKPREDLQERIFKVKVKKMKEKFTNKRRAIAFRDGLKG